MVNHHLVIAADISSFEPEAAAPEEASFKLGSEELASLFPKA
jgi:hypothetical protein